MSVELLELEYQGENLFTTCQNIVDIYCHVSKFGITEENTALFAKSFESIGLTYSVEDIKKTINVIIDKIIEWIQKAIQYIKLFFAKVFNKKEERIKAIEKEIKDITEFHKEYRTDLRAGNFDYKEVNSTAFEKIISILELPDWKISIGEVNYIQEMVDTGKSDNEELIETKHDGRFFNTGLLVVNHCKVCVDRLKTAGTIIESHLTALKMDMLGDIEQGKAGLATPEAVKTWLDEKRKRQDYLMKILHAPEHLIVKIEQCAVEMKMTMEEIAQKFGDK